MKVILTGASSFSGLWFARALAADGHELVMPLRRASPALYGGVRAQRVAELSTIGRISWGLDFGSDAFLAWLRDETVPGLFCHHAAAVSGHRSDEFDVEGALMQNVRRLAEIVALLKRGGCRGLVFSGTYYERNEGAGTEPREAFSRYALAKTISYEVARYHCQAVELPIGKFVMPNPFGPFEEKGFAFALRQKWRTGQVMPVLTPDYVRDNIHVDLLALAYQAFVRRAAPGSERFPKASPSGYVETQGEFALRFQREFRARTGLPCELDLRPQAEFREPADRHNLDPAAPHFPQWVEAEAWDRIASEAS
jgi:UDP-glucose 4-epimerase